MAMSKIKALQIWCKRALEGYRDVNITDMTTSWRSGLAFCAMIHKYRPDLINYDALDKENVYENNKLAFDVAERELNIPALLEAADMVAMKVPDRLSIITYVAQYHNYFKDKPAQGGPGVSVASKQATPGGVKRHHEGSEPQSRPEVKRFTPSHENKQDKIQEKSKNRVASLGETCQICRNKVYLLERHIEDGKLYHRSCFRHSDMSPSSKVYARPSALVEKDEAKDKKLPVNGMRNLGKGFAAPGRSEPERSKSPPRSTARVSLNMNSHSEDRHKPLSSQRDEPQTKTKTSENGHVGELKGTTKSVLDRLEDKSKSDWKSKRSQSPKAERTPYSTSAQRPNDLPGRLSEPSEKRVTDKWPPSKDEKPLPRSKSEGTELRVTPVPRPRQSLLKEEEKSTKAVSKLENKKLSRSVEKMEVDEPAKPAVKNYSSELETRLTKRTEPRKLPLALQSGQGDTKEAKRESPKTVTEAESTDTTDPSPKQRLFLKKNEKKHHGSTEKLDKTVGERIKESKERARLKAKEEKGKAKREESRERLSKDRSKVKTPPVSSPEEMANPPPLPRSTPPDLPKSPPSRPTTPSSSSTPASTPPARPPRSPTQRVASPPPRSGPPKPPRVTTSDQTKEKVTTPETVDDVVSKASQWSKGSEPVAVMVYPGSPPVEDPADQRVLGGLLKSLANVRHRQPDAPVRSDTPEAKTSITVPPRSHATVRSETPEAKTSITVPPRSHATKSTTTVTTTTTTITTTRDKNVLSNNIKNSHSKTSTNVDNKNTEDSYLSRSKQNDTKSTSKSEVIDTTPIPAWQKEVAKRKAEKDSKSKQRPKSTAAILDYHQGKYEPEYSRVTDRSKDKNKPAESSAKDTTPTPAWQKEARQRKENKPSRPKSVEVLSDENGDLCVGEDNLKVLNMTKGLKKKENKKSKESSNSEESIPDWQKEAQKRMEERKGNFVDPEKKRIVPERPERPDRTNLENTTKKHIEIVENGHLADKKNVTKVERTKVSPGIKFNFNDNSLDSSSELSPREERNKKGRQPPPRPKSPPVINRAQKHQRYSAGNRVTPPRSGMSPGKLTPMEIQRQLMDIDTKLTDLELKGRRLEDSIRNAQEDEEDVLMIDWFLLVSQKNELVRQEADLIYAARENELEDEQDSVQDQLRRLLDKKNKTSEDKQQEEYLLGKLLDIVDQRSKIVDSIDDDKHRYEEEDREIAIVLEKKANVRTQERLL